MKLFCLYNEINNFVETSHIQSVMAYKTHMPIPPIYWYDTSFLNELLILVLLLLQFDKNAKRDTLFDQYGPHIEW